REIALIRVEQLHQRRHILVQGRPAAGDRVDEAARGQPDHVGIALPAGKIIDRDGLGGARPVEHGHRVEHVLLVRTCCIALAILSFSPPAPAPTTNSTLPSGRQEPSPFSAAAAAAAPSSTMVAVTKASARLMCICYSLPDRRGSAEQPIRRGGRSARLMWRA